MRGNDADELMVDSGAHAHVAPPDYGRHFELESRTNQIQAYSVTSKQLKIYGLRYVEDQLECDDGRIITLTIGFVVSDVRRPLVATQALVDRGFRVVLDRTSFLEKADTRVSMIRRGNGVYLPGR